MEAVADLGEGPGGGTPYPFWAKIFNRKFFRPLTCLDPPLGRGGNPRGGGVLPYISYIGMCGAKWYGF